MSGRVLIIGTFDTKADEFAFLRERIIENGCEVLAINAGVDGSTDLFPIEVEASIVAAEGGEAIAALRDLGDRGRAITVMSDGAALIARRMFDEGKFDGIIGMGGSGGTGVVTAAMRRNSGSRLITSGAVTRSRNAAGAGPAARST